jgi:hypothetical protein
VSEVERKHEVNPSTKEIPDKPEKPLASDFKRKSYDASYEQKESILFSRRTKPNKMSFEY